MYLQEHVYEWHIPADPDGYRSKLIYTVEEYDSRPVIGEKELTFEGLGLSGDTPMFTYGRDPNVLISRGTVGGGPIPVDDRSEEKAFDSLVEQLKSRGFARPERTK
jgi:hypothetical protein